MTSSEDLRVAIVDDHADSAQTLAMMLKLQGMETQTASNGDEAIALMRAFKPHCVLFDICMPGMDGLELAKRLRATTGDDVILLAMTGLDANDLRVEDTFNLVDHYFQKPFEFKTLLQVLKPNWS
jgi:DNA-binding response OmpR family regulator